MAATAVAVLARRWLQRLEISGESMLPTLEPGDRVLVVRRLRGWPRLSVGDLVTLRDPRRPDRLMVKRIAALGDAGVDVAGDRASASTDSRHFGPVAEAAILGRVVYRYHPDSRRGRLGRAPVTRW